MKQRKNRRLRHRIYRGLGDVWPAIGAGELLLEYFSDTQLIGWLARAQDVQNYHYLWFFELERQRAANHKKLIEALATVPAVSVGLAGWGRALPYRYSHVPLSCVGSLKWVGGRFNYGTDIDAARYVPFPALYLAENLETGFRELFGLVRENRRGGLTAKELALCGESSVTWVSVGGVVQNVFDLTNPDNLRGFVKVLATFKLSRDVRATEEKLRATPLRLITSISELHDSFMTENWREFPAQLSTPSNSQLFGHLISHAGFEGVLYSSTVTGKQNLALFSRQFQNSASTVRALDPPVGARCVELSAATYLDAER